MKIYPNPALDNIHIELSIPDEISIYSKLGQKMHQYAFNAGQHRIETQIVTGGVYFILSKEGSAKLSFKK